jgi:YD repeat-containing protein
VLLICFNLTNAFAQLDIKSPKDFTMHSPNASGLGEYNSYPVNLSTGVPNIDVPLYTIQAGKLSLPLSISYHASGIKVDQDASFIGLGWALNAGGIITRIIKDKPDEYGGFSETGQSIPNYNSIDNINGAGAIENNATLKSWFELKDKEPDLFNLSATGLNDEFCYDNQGQLVSTGLDSLKYSINFLQNLITVVDRKGNTYRFGRGIDDSEAFETTDSYSTRYSIYTPSTGPYIFPEYSSSWYLTEIISADLADTISFKYKTGAYGDSKAVSSVRYLLNDNPGMSVIDAGGTHFDDLYHIEMDKTISNMRVLDKIIYKNGSVQFSTANDRLDINGSYFRPRITGFTVYGQNMNVIRSVSFDNNDYFSRTGNGIDVKGSGYTISNERKMSLKLNGVKFFDKNGIFNNAYSFLYDATPLPPRNTTSQDFWGYYNGKSNTTLIPQTFFVNNAGVPQYYGGNRKADFSYMKAASLKQITLPSGGYTTYEFEPNYYLTDQTAHNQIEQTQSYTLFAINRLSSCKPNYLPGVPANNSLDFQVDSLVTAGGASSALAHVSVMFSDFAVSQSGYAMTFDLWTIDDNGNLGSLIRHLARQPSSDTQPLVLTFDFAVYNGQRFRMIANTNNVTGSHVSLCNSPYIEADLNYQVYHTVDASQVTADQAGGLRVKTISNYDSKNTLLTQRSYEYGSHNIEAGSVGTGKLISDPSKNFYNYPLLYFPQPTHTDGSLKRVLWFTSNSQTELGMNSGCPVDYNKVTVKDVSFTDGTNGKTESYFTYMGNFHEPKSSFMYPYDFYYRPSWLTPTLIKTIYYKGSGEGAYTPIKSVQYDYEMPEKRIKTLALIEYQPDIWYAIWQSDGIGTGIGSFGYFQDNPNRFYRYNFFQSRGKLIKTRELTTDYNGADSLVTQKLFQYNPYYDLKQETYTDNRSQIVQTNYKYTGDVNYTNLIAKNAVSLPIQTEQTVAGKLRSGNISKYNDVTQLTDQYIALTNSTPAAYTSAATIPSGYEKDKSYEYDSDHQNLQVVTPDGGSPNVYIWSYNGQYPVAEIKNATYVAVESALGGATAVSNFRKSMPTDAQVNSFLSILRTGITGAQVTTYTYAPPVGMTSSTDAKGLTTYYEYDAFQRLMNIKDKDGNIVKHMDYHYQNQ